MVATLATLISDTERHLLAGDREEMNSLNGAVDATVTTVTFNYVVGGIQTGAYINVDLEIMYVWSTDDDNRTATVQRAMLGTTAAAHLDDAIVYVNPRFSKFDIADALNQEIRDLSAPPNGLFRVKSFTVTTSPVRQVYEVPVANLDLLAVGEVRYQPPDPALNWPRIPRWEYQVLRNLPTSGNGGVPSGVGIRIEGSLYPGVVLSVQYAAPFTELVNLTDDVVAVSGLPASALDLPPLGAAARLMGVREAKRAFVEAEVDSRRATEVAPGSAARAAQTLLSLLNGRIRTEYARLVKQYPDLM